jgi:hypothetical protein
MFCGLDASVWLLLIRFPRRIGNEHRQGAWVAIDQLWSLVEVAINKHTEVQLNAVRFQEIITNW